MTLSPRDTVVLTVTIQTGDPVFNDPVHISLLTGLEQTPYLNVLAANKVGTALGKLRVSMDPTTMTPPIARQVALRRTAKMHCSSQTSAPLEYSFTQQPYPP